MECSNPSRARAREVLNYITFRFKGSGLYRASRQPYQSKSSRERKRCGISFFRMPLLQSLCLIRKCSSPRHVHAETETCDFPPLHFQ